MMGHTGLEPAGSEASVLSIETDYRTISTNEMLHS